MVLALVESIRVCVPAAFLYSPPTPLRATTPLCTGFRRPLPRLFKGYHQKFGYQDQALAGGYASPDSKTLGGIPSAAGEEAGSKRIEEMLKLLKFHRIEQLNGGYKPIEAGYDEEAADLEYQLVEEEIQDTYREIFALDTIEKQNRALDTWYSYLRRTCTSVKPCIECLRMRRH